MPDPEIVWKPLASAESVRAWWSSSCSWSSALRYGLLTYRDSSAKELINCVDVCWKRVAVVAYTGGTGVLLDIGMRHSHLRLVNGVKGSSVTGFLETVILLPSSYVLVACYDSCITYLCFSAVYSTLVLSFPSLALPHLIAIQPRPYRPSYWPILFPCPSYVHAHTRSSPC